MHTLVSILTGLLVLGGVYVVFAVLRGLADIAIFLIAVVDAFVAGNIHEWYPKIATELSFLPPEFNFKGWAICVVALAIAGALMALPLVPFSSINQKSTPSPNTTS